MRKKMLKAVPVWVLIVLSAGFAAFGQSEATIIEATAQNEATIVVPTIQSEGTIYEPLTVDLNKISEQVAAILENRIAKLEIENGVLKARIEALTKRIETLEGLTNLPTVTPVPEGTLEPTPTPTRTPNPSGYECETTLLSPYYYGEFSRGAEFKFEIRIRNTGTKAWGNEVMLEWVSGLKAEKNPLYAYAMPRSEISPDEVVDFSIDMVAPDELIGDGKHTSRYALKNDQEIFCEFEYNIFVP